MKGLRQLQIYWHWSQLFTILLINFIWSYEDFLFKTHLQQGDYRVNGLFSLYCCWRLCHGQVSLDLREETAALCLSVLILEFLTALCAGRAALPALMWPSASGFRCCQERRDSSVHWPERCPAVPVVSCVWTSRVKPAPETRRAGEGSSTTSWRERMTHSTLGTLVRNSYACDWW